MVRVSTVQNSPKRAPAGRNSPSPPGKEYVSAIIKIKAYIVQYKYFLVPTSKKNEGKRRKDWG